MSRLNDLLRELRSREPALARDLEREVAALSELRAFGLNFERHVPEAVELPGRRVRKGDKVRVLPPRGQVPKKSDEKLWRPAPPDGEGGAQASSSSCAACARYPLFSGPTSNSTSTLMYRGLMGTTLYVGNLSDRATEEILRRVFGAGGRLVVGITIPFDPKSGRPNGYAFVEMSTDEEARSAELEVDGAELEGRMLIVALLKPAADSGGASAT